MHSFHSSFLHGCTPLSLLSQEMYKNMNPFHNLFFAWLYTFVFAVTVAGKEQNMNLFHIVLIAWWLRAEF